MAFFTIDDNLTLFTLHFIKGILDPMLEFEYNRAGRINQFNVILDGQPVGFWWFAMRTYQDLTIAQLLKLLAINHHQTLRAEPLNFHVVVYDVSKTIQRLLVFHLILRHLNGKFHPKTIARIFIYGYLHRLIN